MTYTEQQEPPVAIGEAAHRLGVSVDTLRRWEREHKIVSTRTPGGQRRFAAAEIERVLAGSTEQVAS